VLTSPEANIIAFRGTQLSKEWLQNFQARQIAAAPTSQFRYAGKAHEGFVQVYSELQQATLQSLEQLNPQVPCYITGHSLGAAIALLAGMDSAMRFGDRRERLHIYTYGCPRVGNPAFAESSSQLTPNHYRVVNLADAFTLVPPINIGEYVHVGQEWSFLYPRNDISSNHFVATYRAAIDQEKESDFARQYPSSC
jgi:triacylglycerol lipase